MRSLWTGLLTAAALAALTAAPARAGVIPITVDSGWNTFLFQGVGSQFQDASADPIDFIFTLTQSNVLHVTDGFFDGDQFEVFINGADVGPTSVPTFTGSYVGDNWTAGFYDPTFSSASFALGPGSYDVTGFAIQSPFGAGQAALAVGAIPEPSVWTMMILGLGAIGASLRRRRGVAVTA